MDLNKGDGQFDGVEVVRGVRGVNLNKESVGSHWTTNPNVAGYFASNEASRGSSRGSSIINAVVPNSSVESDASVLRSKGVGDTQRHEGGPINESEVTVRKGAPVKVKSITHVGPKKRGKVHKEAEKIENEVPISTDYQQPGDSEKLERASKTLDRTRTRTFKPPREMRA
jgi:hypothetical protein